MLKIPNHIMKPSRYTGIEPHSIMKNIKDVEVRFALCYPDLYEIGMSYFGHFLLYEIANNIENVWCERCYAPWADMEQYLRESNTPLFTLESKTPLADMDIVGFSLTYELNVTNVLNMLDLGGIRIRAEEREKGPIVIAGGPLMLNPGQYERFFDLIVVGEADEVIVKIIKAMRLLKGLPRDYVVEQLSKFDGLYSPLYPKEKVTREYMKDLNKAYHPVSQPIPTVGSIHNRLNVEISRGCPNGCRFCMAGFGYRPYRERSFKTVKEIIDRGLQSTGYEEISLLSLSSGDYSALFDVIDYVKTNYHGVALSLPSLKIGSIGENEISAIGGIARTGFTFALEAATPELRCRLNKNIDVDLLTQQLPLLKKYGWKRLKLYLMIGFPWETEEDLLSMKEVMAPFRKEGMEINLSISPFIPKPHTPFQWLPMDTEKVLNEKIAFVKSTLKGRGVKVKYRDPKLSLIEGIISRGDRRLSFLFESLFRQGVRLEAWREFFSPEPYAKWFDENSIAVEEYLGGKDTAQPLPWAFIDTGVDASFLGEESRNAGEARGTVNCLEGCAGCGLECRDAGYRVRDAQTKMSGETGSILSDVGHESQAVAAAPSAPPRRFTFRYAKCGDARYIGHIDTMNIILRAIRSSGIKINMHGKYHPLPRIVLSDALPIGIESTCEFIEIETAHDVEIAAGTVAAINSGMPRGMKVRELLAGSLKDMVKDYIYILVTKEDMSGELVQWKKGNGRFCYLWRERNVKELRGRGVFERIIKVEARRIHDI